jgi:DNA repair exonuclease SbcCD ATPase subunit
MESFPSKDQIEFLVNRQFRWFSREHVGEVNILRPSGAFRKYRNILEAMNAHKAELLEKAAEGIQNLYEDECAKEQEEKRVKAEQDEAQRFFNRQDAVADVAHWSKTAFWSLDEATALSFGKEPRIVSWKNVKEYTGASAFAYRYERLRDLILRAKTARLFGDPVPPGFYIAWAKRNDIDFPADLEAAVVVRGGQIGDWKSKYDELSSRYDSLISSLDTLQQQVQNDQEIKNNLRERIAELEAELNAAPKADVGLHGKERDSVLKLL